MPTSLDLPAGVKRTIVASARGAFAVLEALPAAGACELGTALLVPGYTGSKEDFIPVLEQLAAGGRRVLAVDMRGQYETPGPDDPASYHPESLGKDIAALAAAAQATHLLGHSFGGLVAREAVLSGGYAPASLTLLGSGPSALPPGPRADILRFMLDLIGGTPAAGLPDKIAQAWQDYLKPEAVANGAPPPVLEFLQRRMLANNPTGLVTMARHLLSAPERTAELAAREIPTFVLYGEDDDAWPADVQEEMAARLGAARRCIPAAAHSPAVEAPATTALALTQFWDAADGVSAAAAATTRTLEEATGPEPAWSVQSSARPSHGRRGTAAARPSRQCLR